MTEREPVKDRLRRLTDDQLRLVAEQADSQAETAEDPFIREMLSGLAVLTVSVLAERAQCKIIGAILAERQELVNALDSMTRGH